MQTVNRLPNHGYRRRLSHSCSLDHVTGGVCSHARGTANGQDEAHTTLAARDPIYTICQSREEGRSITERNKAEQSTGRPSRRLVFGPCTRTSLSLRHQPVRGSYQPICAELPISCRDWHVPLPKLKRISDLCRLHKIRILHCPNLQVPSALEYLTAMNSRCLQLDSNKKTHESLSPGSSEWNRIKEYFFLIMEQSSSLCRLGMVHSWESVQIEAIRLKLLHPKKEIKTTDTNNSKSSDQQFFFAMKFRPTIWSTKSLEKN
jgi:hypothetical protein